MTHCNGYDLHGSATDGVRVYLTLPDRSVLLGGYRRTHAPGDDRFVLYDLDGEPSRCVRHSESGAIALLLHGTRAPLSPSLRAALFV